MAKKNQPRFQQSTELNNNKQYFFENIQTAGLKHYSFWLIWGASIYLGIWLGYASG